MTDETMAPPAAAAAPDVPALITAATTRVAALLAMWQEAGVDVDALLTKVEAEVDTYKDTRRQIEDPNDPTKLIDNPDFGKVMHVNVDTIAGLIREAVLGGHQLAVIKVAAQELANFVMAGGKSEVRKMGIRWA